MTDLFNKEQLLHITLLLTLLANVCVIIGTVTSHWFVYTIADEENSIGPFCKNTNNADWECLPTSIDALCIVSIVLLSATTILGILLIKPTVKWELARFSLVTVLFTASVLLLAIIPLRNNSYGFSFQLMMTACALAQLGILISGVRLGGIFRKEPSKTVTFCTEPVLSFLTRGLTVLIAVFTIVGMSTSHWIGKNTLGGWSGAGTFCRQYNVTSDSCLIPTSTSVLSVTAAILSLVIIVFVVCGILNAVRRRVECYAISIFLFPTSITLWFTIATTTYLEFTGYSFRMIIAAGPCINLALFFGGIWLSISGKPPFNVNRRF